MLSKGAETRASAPWGVRDVSQAGRRAPGRPGSWEPLTLPLSAAACSWVVHSPWGRVQRSCGGFSSCRCRLGTRTPEEESVAREPGMQFEVWKDKAWGEEAAGIYCGHASLSPTSTRLLLRPPTLGVKKVKPSEVKRIVPGPRDGTCQIRAQICLTSKPFLTAPLSE